jgi:FKBP-type peptidyl-prolyl cis-trans isomerase FkpA
MKKMYLRFNVYAVSVLALLFLFGCKKYDEPYSAAKETDLIKTWVRTQVKNNSIVDSTSTGLYYIFDKAGTGPVVQEGNNVTLKYTGEFLDGSVFDSSESFTYVHKAADQRMIPGFEEGIEKLSKGGSGVFLIPSAQAYGTNGYSSIPPYTPLLFIIEIIDIK